MSILIKDMEMPIKCAKCPIADISAEYYFCEKIDWFGKERPSDCPLIELPPHGRLIDADALLNKTICNPLWSPYITKKMVLDAKTVIEAEDGT